MQEVTRLVPFISGFSGKLSLQLHNTPVTFLEAKQPSCQSTGHLTLQRNPKGPCTKQEDPVTVVLSLPNPSKLILKMQLTFKNWPTPNLFSSSSQSFAAAFQYLCIISIYMRSNFVMLTLQMQLTDSEQVLAFRESGPVSASISHASTWVL